MTGHRLAAVAADAGRGRYHIYYCSCARDFALLEDLRNHMIEATKADWEEFYRNRPLASQNALSAKQERP